MQFEHDFQEIRAAGMFPAALSLKHPDTQVVVLDNYVRRSLSMIHGIYLGNAYVAQVDNNNALRNTSYGTGFRMIAGKAGTAPASYDGTNEIDDGNEYHRFDILVETEQAAIRFLMSDGNYSSDIPLIVGFHSILFSSKQVQIKYRNASAGTYTITAYR